MVETKFLNVLCGDAILIRFPGNHGKFVNILIDGGYVKTYQSVLKPHLIKIRDLGEKIDLLILSHYDNDHIGGILSFIRDKDFQPTFVDTWWTNVDVALGTADGKISTGQLMMLKDFLDQKGKSPKVPLTNEHPAFHLFGAEITLLSPTRNGYLTALNFQESHPTQIAAANDHLVPLEDLSKKVQIEAEMDPSIPNQSSIAILLKISGVNFLLLADAHPGIVASSLTKLGYSDKHRLKLEWMKVSHHGSKLNTSNSLLDCIETQNYIFSVNGINRSGLPHKETLVRILERSFRDNTHVLYLHFTHNDFPLSKIFSSDPDEAVKKLNFALKFPVKNNELIINTKI